MAYLPAFNSRDDLLNIVVLYIKSYHSFNNYLAVAGIKSLSIRYISLFDLDKLLDGVRYCKFHSTWSPQTIGLFKGIIWSTWKPFGQFYRFPLFYPKIGQI